MYINLKMFNKIKNISAYILLILILISKPVYSQIINKIEIVGNERITDETIIMFSNYNGLSINSDQDLNVILKNIYDTNFFKNVSINFSNNILTINVEEFPIIENIFFEGIKANKIKEKVFANLKLKSRSSFNNVFLKQDKNKIENNLKDLGYFFRCRSNFD